MSFEVRLAIKVLENILDNEKLKASVYRSSVDGEVTAVVSVFGVDGVAGTARAVDGLALSANLTLDGVDRFTGMSVSSSEFDIINFFSKFTGNSLKIFKNFIRLFCGVI